MTLIIMTPERRKELEDDGYTVYSENEARELIAEDIFDGLVYDQSSIWDLVWSGYKGVNDMTLEDIENYFDDDDIIFEWSEIKLQ